MQTSRERFFALKNKRRYERITLPGLGEFRVRSLLEGERAEVEILSGEQRLVKRALVVHGLCEHHADIPVFDAEDIQALGELDSTLIDMIAAAVLKITGSNDFGSLLGEPARSCEPTSSSEQPTDSAPTSGSSTRSKKS